MSADYADFIPSINIHVAMCPRVVMINAVKSIVRMFLDETKSWVLEYKPHQICKFHGESKCQCNNERLSFSIHIPDRTHIDKIWSIFGMNGVKEYRIDNTPLHHITSENYLVFDEKLTQSQINSLCAVISLSTNQDSLHCPDFVYQQYLDIIVHGACWYLMNMDAREWTNPNLAMIHYQQFMSGIESVKEKITQGFGVGYQKARVKPHYM